MKKLLLVLFFTAMGMFKGQSQALVQTYIDRCTGAVSVFSVPMGGNTIVAFYNRSRSFTSQDFQDGTLQVWLEETYLWWTSLSPCSTVTTGAQATQQTTQQTTQQATQAATNAAANTANINPPPNVTPSTPTSAPTTTAAPTTTSTTPDTTNTNTSNPDTPSVGADTNGQGNNTTTTEGPKTSSGNSESNTDTSESTSTKETSNTDQNQESSSSEDTSGGDTGSDSGKEETSNTESEGSESTESSSEEGSDSEGEGGDSKESSDDEQTDEETIEEESTEEKSDEEPTEEETDEKSEEDTEEESDEEESKSDEDEETEEEDTEEESNNEDEEEDKKKKKKKRNLAPPIVTANAMSQQLPTGEFQQAVTFGLSQSSLMGTETYGLNAMVYDNLQQFMLTANYSKVHINKEGRISRVYSASIGGMKMYTTYMAMMNHSFTFLGKKGSVAGIAFGTSLTTNEVDVIDSRLYLDNQFLGLSLTGFYTKSFQATDKLSISPMLAISSPFMMFDMFKHTTIINKDLMFIGGSSFSYKLTQRFGLNLGANVIESTAENFPTMMAFTIGGRLSF